MGRDLLSCASTRLVATNAANQPMQAIIVLNLMLHPHDHTGRCTTQSPAALAKCVICAGGAKASRDLRCLNVDWRIGGCDLATTHVPLRPGRATCPCRVDH